MNLSGNLRDVSIQDLLLFLKRGERTGSLALRRGEQKASVTLRDGEPVSVRMPGTPRLGDLLLASGLSDPITVREAARVQAEEEIRRPLGQILVAHGAIDRERLGRLIRQQLDLALTKLLDWAREGSYTFFTGEPVHDGDLCLELGEPHSAANRWAAQLQNDREILLAIAEATLVDKDSAPRSGNDDRQPRVLIVSHDRILCEQLSAALPQRLAPPIRLRPQSAAAKRAGTEADGRPPVVVVDLRTGGVPPEDLAALRQDRPGMPLIAILEEVDSPSRAFAAGALATTPAEVLMLTACIENAAALVETLWRGESDRRVAGSFDAETVVQPASRSPVTALELLQSIASVTERAILFALTADGLESSGAFGTSAEGQPLAEVTRGLCLELSSAGVLALCLADGKPRRVTLTSGALPEKLARRIGLPAHDEVAVLPITAADGRVTSVLYTDNGALDSPLGSLEAFESAAEQLAIRSA